MKNNIPKIILIVAVIGAIVFFGKSIQENEAKKLKEKMVVEIVFETKSPALDATIKLYGPERKLAYSGTKKSSENTGKEELTLGIKENSFNNVANKLEENGFWSMEEQYDSESEATDISYKLTVKYFPEGVNPERANTEVKTVNCESNSKCIQQFRDIGSSMEELIDL